MLIFSTAFSSERLSLIEQKHQAFKSHGMDLSDELGEAIFYRLQDGGWLRLTTPSVVEELVRMPDLARRVLRIQLGPCAMKAFALTGHRWQHLEGVALNFCDLKEIPAWVLSLPNLNHLSLWGNVGINIPDEVTFPPLLQVIDLDGCELVRVPLGLSRLRFLTLIGLSFNPRKLELPEWLAKRQRREETEVRGLWC